MKIYTDLRDCNQITKDIDYCRGIEKRKQIVLIVDKMYLKVERGKTVLVPGCGDQV